MEIITVEVSPSKIVITDGYVKGSRLKWRAPGIDIYLKGAVPIKMRDRVQYCVLQACLSRHIPLISLVSYGWV